jgi:hypothetical protein
MADIVATGFWIRAVGDQIKDVWDYKPSQDILDTQGGWREAIQITPEVNPMRQYISHHTIDISVTPAEIIWHIADLTVDDRKGALIGKAQMNYNNILNAEVAKESDTDPDSHMDMAVVEAANTSYKARVAQVQACTTQEELDAIWND